MLINIHTHHLDDVNNISIYNQYPWEFVNNDSYYSIGIHPIFIDKSNPEKDLETIKLHIQNKKCLAIGEIGLDKLCEIDFDLQIDIFKKQLEIAELNKIPVIIHCVRSYQEILQIRKSMKLSIPFIFHGFNKNKNLLQQVISNNSIPSFGKNLLYNTNLQSIFADLSEDNFFLENDNDEIPILEIYQKAAEIRGTTVEAIEKIVQHNFNTIFNYNFE